MRKLLLGLAPLVTAFLIVGMGCGKKVDTAKFAGLCTEATKQLQENSSKADDKTFKMMLQNALTACSTACDGEDQPSCKALDGHVNKICGVSPGMCETLCKTVTSPSLKKTTCDFKKP